MRWIPIVVLLISGCRELAEDLLVRRANFQNGDADSDGADGAANSGTPFEQKCANLGVNCICSEPLDAPGLAISPNGTGGGLINPSASTTYECSLGDSGQAISTDDLNCFDIANDPTVLAALPSGHQMSWFYRGRDSQRCIHNIGHILGPTPVKRVAMRWYVYHSTDYDFLGSGAPTLGCDSQMVGFDQGLQISNARGGIGVSNFVNANPSQDCCANNPGGEANTLESSWLGKWWRAEVVLTDRDCTALGTCNWRLQMYLQNVTDGTAEFRAVDTALTDPELNFSSNRFWPARMDSISVANYRAENVPNQCTGFRALSHVMIAGWDVDLGQRIGRANEVEGP